MSEHEPTSAEERRAQEVLRTLTRPAADPAFRARLKQTFADGSIQPGLPAGAETARGAAGTEARESRAHVLRGPWFVDRRAQAGLAIAAAVLVVTAVALNRPGKWTVSDTTGEGIVNVDGRGIPMNHRDELAAALHPGSRVRVPFGTELEITSPRNLVIQFTAGTDATVPQPPGRWFGRTIRGGIREGQLRITTGPAFRGARLAIATPEAEVEVSGTTLAVIREPHGTCVCVLEGRVRVGAKGGEMSEVENGHLRFVFNDGRPPGSDDMRPIEREKLEMLKESRDWSPR